MITIRKYRDIDYSRLKDLLSSVGLYDATWESESNLKGMKSVLAWDGEHLVGNIFLIPYGANVLLIFRLAVDKKYQKQGVATMLLDYVTDNFKKDGGKEIGLFVDSDKDVLHQFYAKRGFQKSTTESKFEVMWKPLI